MRNLKVCIHEHTLCSSKSTISLHVQQADADQDHSIVEYSMLVIAQEKNMCKRKFMETICIKAKAL